MPLHGFGAVSVVMVSHGKWPLCTLTAYFMEGLLRRSMSRKCSQKGLAIKSAVNLNKRKNTSGKIEAGLGQKLPLLNIRRQWALLS